MTVSPPAVTVVIPTHNRRASVSRTLEALASQTMSPDRFEVIVVADGCGDDTASALRSLTLPYPLRVIEQPGQGQGKARNVGSESAKGKILVFLDDDIVPHPNLLEAYERRHGENSSTLILGPAIPVLAEEKSFFSHGLRNWWYDHLRALTSPAHRFSYRDMHSGNFSMTAALFAECGGFDPTFFRRSGEDYEFGIRLLSRGIPFVVEPGASAHHHDATDLARSLIRVRMEGRADVLIGIRHPELRTGTGLTRFRSPSSRATRALYHLAFRHPRSGDLLARLLHATLGPLQQLRMRKWWQKVHGALRSYWYCRGAALELDISAPGLTLEQFLSQAPARPVPPAIIDLGAGLPASEQTIDALRPDGIRIDLRGVTIGSIAAIPGAEPVRGVHLREFLVRGAAYDLLVAAALARVGAGQDDGWTG